MTIQSRLSAQFLTDVWQHIQPKLHVSRRCTTCARCSKPTLYSTCRHETTSKQRTTQHLCNLFTVHEEWWTTWIHAQHCFITPHVVWDYDAFVGRPHHIHVHRSSVIQWSERMSSHHLSIKCYFKIVLITLPS